MDKKPNTVAIIQARTGSTRLPGKVLMQVCGKPVLQHIIERIKKSRFVQTVVVATTTTQSDVPIVDLARKCGVSTFTGSENDVLDRFYQTARSFSARVIVRITADDPFKDPTVMDKVVAHYLKNQDKLDYVSNTIKPTYPLGLDIEVFSFEALEKAWQEATESYDREHVTPYIWNHPDRFRLANIENRQDLSHLRWTLDYEADLRFTEQVYGKLYADGNIFLMQDILDLLEKEPTLSDLNKRAAGGPE